MTEDEIVKVLVGLRKDELELQAKTFDQIDSKTGIALGFLLVAIGQVLSGFLSLFGKQQHLGIAALSPIRWIAGAGGMTSLGALVCGVISRWPATFQYDIAVKGKLAKDEVQSAWKQILNDYEKCVEANHKTLKKKGRWADWTYLGTALTLLIYISLVIVATYRLGRG